LPIYKEAISEVFQNISKYKIFDVVISSSNDKKINELLDTLKNCNILRYDQEKENYVMHPLIQNYYSKLLEKETKFLIVHCCIKDYYIKHYYLKITDIPIEPTLVDMKYPIEAIHHACYSKDYINAWEIYTEKAWEIYTKYICPSKISIMTYSSPPGNINKEPLNYTLTNKLGAYETVLSIMKNFFPNGNLNKEPLIDDLFINSSILGHVRFCLMSLGNLKEAASFYERANKISLKIKDWRNLSYGYQNLARLYIYLGKLELSKDVSQKAEKSARSRRSRTRADKKSLLNSWCWLATVNQLTGNLGMLEI
jgi:tetratricopeptide (TPR) repeat protein